MAEVPVPTEQSRRFLLAVCERLGIDPSCVRMDGMNVTVSSGQPYADIAIQAFLPTDGVVDLFNNSGTNHE